MNSQTQPLLIPGPAGTLELAVDSPAGEARGVAVVAHPHPLFGGSLGNKVVQTLARAFVQQGWRAVRFNFRGVGQSTGEHDAGRGELADLLAVVQSQAAQGPLCLAGFSFGAFVTSHAVQALHPTRDIHRLLLVGTAASRFTVAPVAPVAPVSPLGPAGPTGRGLAWCQTLRFSSVLGLVVRVLRDGRAGSSRVGSWGCRGSRLDSAPSSAT